MVESTSIIIKDFKLYAHHGCIQEERDKGQYFYLDIKVTLKKSVSDDCLNSSIDYVKICNFVETLFKADKYNLLESLSLKICKKLIEAFDLKSVAVEIKKKKNSFMPNIDSFSAVVRVDL